MTDRDIKLDTSRPAAARRYNYWLGAKDNFAADRASADAVSEAFPGITAAVAENRRCLLRTVRYLATERGIRQFLDVGCGMPGQAGGDVHEVAQRIAADCRIVYVDNDLMVDVHTRALAVGRPQGEVTFQHGDLRAPAEIMSGDTVRQTLDLTRPVAVLLFAVLHFLPDDQSARQAIRELMKPLPAGSVAAVSHATLDPQPETVRARLEQFSKPDSPHGPFRPRTRAEISALLAGFDLLEPGLVSTVDWRPTWSRRPTRTWTRPTPACSSRWR